MDNPIIDDCVIYIFYDEFLLPLNDYLDQIEFDSCLKYFTIHHNSNPIIMMVCSLLLGGEVMECEFLNLSEFFVQIKCLPFPQSNPGSNSITIHQAWTFLSKSE